MTDTNWEAMRGATDTAFEIIGHVGDRSHSVQIAQVNAPRRVTGMDDATRVEAGMLTEAEALPIARMFAAAPDLLAALEAVAELPWEDMAVAHDQHFAFSGDWFERIFAARNATRAAIKKARGPQEDTNDGN